MSAVILVLTDDDLFAYQRKRSKVLFIESVSLDADIEAFIHKTVNKYRVLSCTLILDRSDEEFLVESLPPMRTPMRNKAIAVKLSRHFGSDALTLGSPVKGRRKTDDNRVLCAGVANANSLQKLLQAMQHQGVVVAAIFSLAILLARQCRSSSFQTQALLLISSYDGSVWRYSLIDSGDLLLSRSVFIGESTNKYAEVAAELGITSAYASQLLGEGVAITTVYAGGRDHDDASPAGKLIGSIRRRYSLYETNDLYGEVIRNSRFFAWMSSAYTSDYTRSLYRRYLIANAAVVVSAVLLVVTAAHFYLSEVHNSEISAKTLLINSAASKQAPETGKKQTASVISGLTLVELKSVVDRFTSFELNRKARELQYQLALVMSQHPEIILLKVSFTKEQPDSSERTILSASFLSQAQKGAIGKAVAFVEAVEESQVEVLEREGLKRQLDKKGVLGGDDAAQHPKALRFTLKFTTKGQG